MVSLGFSLVLEPKSIEPIEIAEPLLTLSESLAEPSESRLFQQWETESGSRGDLQQFLSTFFGGFTNIECLHCADSLGFVLIMEMIEPNVDSGRLEDLDKWKQWFDAIKANLESLNQTLIAIA